MGPCEGVWLISGLWGRAQIPPSQETEYQALECLVSTSGREKFQPATELEWNGCFSLARRPFQGAFGPRVLHRQARELGDGAGRSSLMKCRCCPTRRDNRKFSRLGCLLLGILVSCLTMEPGWRQEGLRGACVFPLSLGTFVDPWHGRVGHLGNRVSG